MMKGETTPLIARRQRPQQQQDSNNDGYATSVDHDKADRRPMLGRLNAAMSSMFSPVTKYTPVDADEFYEDTYNDYPWKCSCGTHEEVSNRSLDAEIYTPLFLTEIVFVFRTGSG